MAAAKNRRKKIKHRPINRVAAQINFLKICAYSFADSWEDIDGGGRGVELPAAVVAHPDGGEAALQSAHGVLRSADTLDCARAVAPLLAQPGRVGPAEGRVDLAVDEGGQAIRRHVLLYQRVLVCGGRKKIPKIIIADLPALFSNETSVFL